MTHPYRCTHDGCRKRVTLRMKLTQYLRARKCPECERELKGKEDLAMRARDKRRTCKCSGYMFPHRKGSKWCEFSTVRISDADYEQRYGRSAA